MKIRTVQRGYHARGKIPAGQVRRVHVSRDDDPAPGWGPGDQTLCGQGTWQAKDSPPIIRDAPHELPEGLSWCPTCIGLLAERAGLLDEMARLIGVMEWQSLEGDGVGYEKCGRPEKYPYEQLFDGKPHIILVTSEGPLRALRYGAERRGLQFTQRRINASRYEIMAVRAARVEDSRLPSE